MIKKILTATFAASMVAGFVIVLGTAGASDIDAIEFKTVVVRGIVGVVAMAIGYIGLRETAY